MSIRISKYLSSAGVCSRRDAEKLIIEKKSNREFKIKDPIHKFNYKFKTLHKDLRLVFDLINSFDVLSMSALIDLLSANYLNKL